MRHLLLLRHAKAEILQSGERDHERVLTARGQADAKVIGAYLAKHRAIPDRAVVSTSARTRETWEGVASELRRTPPMDFDARLYDASPRAILEVLKETGADAGTLLVIAHNPGLHELAAMLVATGDIDTSERLGENFPTSALAVIRFAATDWSGVHAKGGRLEHFVTPKSLAGTMD